jgi:hypothetical protein
VQWDRHRRGQRRDLHERLRQQLHSSGNDYDYDDTRRIV